MVAKIDGEAYAGPGALLKAVGMTLVSTVGGASGPLYGTFFLRCGAALGEADSVDAAAFGAALRAGVAGVQARGKAEAGDKTMLDAWQPAVEAYDGALGGGGDLGRGAAGGGRGGGGGPGRHGRPGGPQGPGQLSRRAQPRAPGSRRDQHHDHPRGRGRDAAVIGVVVVSHSRDLAEAAVALAREMVPPDAPLQVAVAAGVADGGFGTDATAVAAAIEAVDGPDGVLVLLDLGSAVLSAELAVELLPPERG